MNHFHLAPRRNLRHTNDMRYADRTSRALDLAGGREEVIEAMRNSTSPSWNDPVHAMETWLWRGEFSSHGKAIIYSLAAKNRKFVGDDDFAVTDENGAVVEPRSKRGKGRSSRMEAVA